MSRVVSRASRELCFRERAGDFGGCGHDGRQRGGPGDYTAMPLTTLTFAPGETSKTVAVAMLMIPLPKATKSSRSA